MSGILTNQVPEVKAEYFSATSDGSRRTAVAGGGETAGSFGTAIQHLSPYIVLHLPPSQA